MLKKESFVWEKVLAEVTPLVDNPELWEPGQCGAVWYDYRYHENDGSIYQVVFRTGSDADEFFPRRPMTLEGVYKGWEWDSEEELYDALLRRGINPTPKFLEVSNEIPNVFHTWHSDFSFSEDDHPEIRAMYEKLKHISSDIE